MKKLKLLPTVLMLVLCVGVLAVGVFAITPTKNTISGTITVNASNNLVKIEVLNGTTSLNTYEEVRSGQPISFGDMSFTTATANTLEQVPEVRLTLKVTNKSNKTLGAFFTKGNVTFADGEYAELGDILVKDTDFSEYINFYCSSYTPIEVGDTEEMAISLTLKEFNAGTENIVVNLNHILYIEEYIPTEDADPNVDGWQAPGEYTPDFVKVPVNTPYLPHYDEDRGIYAIPRSSATTNSVVFVSEVSDSDVSDFYFISNVPNVADKKFITHGIWDAPLARSPYMPFVPSLVNNFEFRVAETYYCGAFVSLENQTYFNDSQYALYNK